MSKINNVAAVEAILFTMGESVEIDKIAKALEISKKEVIKSINELKASLEESNRGLKLIELEESVQLCTKPEMYDILVKIAKQPRKQILTDVLMETLSIIAYKQPITKGEIERIRGVKCDHAVNKLVEYELVEEVGRLETPGRPLLFGTTEEFLRRFGVTSADNLPEIDVDMIEEFKNEIEKEVEQEVSLKSND